MLGVGIAWKGEGEAWAEVLKPWGGEGEYLEAGRLRWLAQPSCWQIVTCRAQVRSTCVELGTFCLALLRSELSNIGAYWWFRVFSVLHHHRLKTEVL